MTYSGSNAGLIYGCDYNPEQWPPEMVAEDIALMRQAGVTMVTLGVFAWALLEPREGEYDFRWLDDVVSQLSVAGIKIDLGTATASPPAWLGQKYPETLPVTAEGVRLGHGSRQTYCPSSQIFREKTAALARRMAERYADNPQVIMWHVSNEYGCHIYECYCDEAVERFRGWLQEKYGSLDELNRVWGTRFWSQTYYDWEEVSAPRAMPTFHNPLQLLDWRRFSDEQMRACYRAEREAIKAVKPDAVVMTNFMDTAFNMDYRVWAREQDIIANDTYPDPADSYAAREFAFNADLMRGLGDGKPFLQLEQAVNGVQWRPRNATFSPGLYQLWALQTIGRGADGICNFQWRQSVAGAETFHSAMVPHAGPESRIFREVKQLGKTMRKLASVAGTAVPARAALMLDWDSRWAAHYAHGPVEGDTFSEARAWHAAFFEANIPLDIVFPDSDLSGYQVIIAPALFRLTGETAAKLQAAAEAGAQVLLTYYTGLTDDDAHAYQGGYLRPLSEAWGIRISEVAPIATGPVRLGSEDTEVAASLGLVPTGMNYQEKGDTAVQVEIDPETERISAAVRTPAADRSAPISGIGDMPNLRGMSWQERVEVLAEEDVSVLARFASGVMADQPALTHRSLGAGGAWYVATDLDMRSRAAVLRRLVAGTEVGPLLADLPLGVEVIQRGSVLFVLNHAPTQVQVLNRALVGRDLISGQEINALVELDGRAGVAIELAHELPVSDE